VTTFTFPRIHPTAAVSAALIAAGFPVIAFTELQRDQDGEVDLSLHVHVQVGVNYFGVVRKNDDGTYNFYPERRSLKALLADVRKAMAPR
jgi:hypothetical protein